MAVQNINNYRRGRQQGAVVKSGTQQYVGGGNVPTAGQIVQQAKQNIERNFQTANPLTMGGAYLYTSQFSDEALADARERAKRGDVISQLYVSTAEGLLSPVQETYTRDSRSQNPVLSLASGLVQTIPSAIAQIPAGLQAANLIQQGQSDIIKKGYTSIPGIVTDVISESKEAPLAVLGGVAGGAALGAAGVGRISVGKVNKNVIDVKPVNKGGNNRVIGGKQKTRPPSNAQRVKTIRNSEGKVVLQGPKPTPGQRVQRVKTTAKKAVGNAVPPEYRRIKNVKTDDSGRKLKTIRNSEGKVVLQGLKPTPGQRVQRVKSTVGKTLGGGKPKITNPPKNKKVITIRDSQGKVVLEGPKPTPGQRVQRVKSTVGKTLRGKKPRIILTIPGNGANNKNLVVIDTLTITDEIPISSQKIPNKIKFLENAIIDGDMLRVIDSTGRVLFEAPLPSDMVKGGVTKTEGNSQPTNTVTTTKKQTNDKPKTTSGGGGNVLLMKEKPETVTLDSEKPKKGGSSKKTTISKQIAPSESFNVKRTTPKTKTKVVASTASVNNLVNLPKTIKLIEEGEEETLIEDVNIPNPPTPSTSNNETTLTDEDTTTDTDNIPIIVSIPLLRLKQNTSEIQGVITIPISETVSTQRQIRRVSSATSPTPAPRRRRKMKDEEDEPKKKKKVRKSKPKSYIQKTNPLPWEADAEDTSWLRKDMAFMRMPARVKVTEVRPKLEAYNEKVKAFNAARKKLRNTATQASAEGRKALATLKRLYMAAFEAREGVVKTIQKNRR